MKSFLVRGILVAVVTWGVLFVSRSTMVSADDSICTGYVTGSHDNVLVPGGAMCSLYGATVDGNVKVEAGGRLEAHSTNVHGNIQADGASLLQLFNMTVGGNIQIKNSAHVVVAYSSVGGNLQVDGNIGPDFVWGNNVGGNLEGDADTILRMLGGLGLTGYCLSLGHRWDTLLTRDTLSPGFIQGPDAAFNNWHCVGIDNALHPISFYGACSWQYGRSDIVGFPTNPNDAYTWTCFAVE